MCEINNIEPITDGILFKFCEDVVNKNFQTKTQSGLIIKRDISNQMSENRWGVALKVGPKVKNVKPGDYIYIEKCQWTLGLHYNNSEKFWKTNESKVIATMDIHPDI